MQKPANLPVSTDSSYDYDIAERLTRQLQDSPLHVYWGAGLMALPDALRTGNPGDDLTSLGFSLAMVTDGRRGWLVLDREADDFDAQAEITELLCCMSAGDPGRDFIVRTAAIYATEPGIRPRTLRLDDPPAVRHIIEREYATGFTNAPPIDHARFLASFEAHNFALRDEREQRQEILDLGDPPTFLGTAPAPPTKAPRTKAPRNAPCPCGSGRKYKKCCGTPPTARRGCP